MPVPALLDAARAGLGAALPAVSPVRLSARPRHGADPSVTGAAVEAVRALLSACETGRAARRNGRAERRTC